MVCDVAGTQPDTTAMVSMIVQMWFKLQHNPLPLLRVMPPKSCAMAVGDRQAKHASGTCCHGVGLAAIVMVIHAEAVEAAKRQVTAANALALPAAWSNICSGS